MDIMSLLPIVIIMIFGIFSKLNKNTTKTNQRPRNPYAPSSPWAFNNETSLPKRFPSKSPIPDSEIVKDLNNFSLKEVSLIDNTTESEGIYGIEGTAGVEGTVKPIIMSEIKIPQSESTPYYPDLSGKNLADAVIWSEILGKPKSRINRPPRRNF